MNKKSTAPALAYALAATIVGLSSQPVLAQTQKVSLETLHSFDGTDGSYPGTPLIRGPHGRFYGVVSDGGIQSNGTIFSIDPDGSFKLLYQFTGGDDGSQPGSLWRYQGTIYGLSAIGGQTGDGTAFTVDAEGNLTVLHQFDFSDGDQAGGAVVVTNGSFVGTSSLGGLWGNIYQMSPSGAINVLYSFTNGADESLPNGVMLASDGNYYGTTYGWVNEQRGTIWRLAADGTFTTLYTFTGDTDGGRPTAPPVEGPDGNFYGTTTEGGSNGAGVIYRLTPSGQFSVVYSFTGGADGAIPQAGLIVGKDGMMYGSTLGGGPAATIFRLSTDGQLTILYTFNGQNGGNIVAPLLETRPGVFYGVSETGGASGNGTVFRLTVRDGAEGE